MGIAKSTNVYPNEMPMVNQRVDGSLYWTDSLGHDMVRIEVGTGNERVVFALHQRILCNKIPFFNKMFNGKFQESVSHTAMMPEDNVDAFKIMIGWVYNEVIELNIGFECENSSSMALVELLILAEKYDISPFVDATMDYLVNLLRQKHLMIGQAMWLHAYKHTCRASKLRLFVTRVAVFAMRCKDGEFSDNTVFWSLREVHSILSQDPEMLMDYLAMTQGAEPQEHPLKKPLCDYHRHGADERCPYTLKASANIPNANDNKPSYELNRWYGMELNACMHV
ncbi:hypothetical protein EAF04_002418 [Stromatinia cepivora]|nr:hypothetical protein EAF04_002418 [Stromatinia cepivora]